MHSESYCKGDGEGNLQIKGCAIIPLEEYFNLIDKSHPSYDQIKSMVPKKGEPLIVWGKKLRGYLFSNEEHK